MTVVNSKEFLIAKANLTTISFWIYISSSCGSTWSLFTNNYNYSIYANVYNHDAGSVSMSESGKYMLYGSIISSQVGLPVMGENNTYISNSYIYISSSYGSSWYLLTSFDFYKLTSSLYLGQLYIILLQAFRRRIHRLRIYRL